MKIILIRHGETQPNAQKRYVGWTDCSLNKKGRRQARKIGQYLSGDTIHKVYASDLKRAIEFAKIAFKDASIEKITDLREINFGVFEGMTHEEIIKKYPQHYKAWLSDPYKTAIPKGESLSHLAKRVRRSLKKFVSDNRNKTFVVVSHKGPLKIVLGDIMRSKGFWDISVDNASISIIEKMEPTQASAKGGSASGGKAEIQRSPSVGGQALGGMPKRPKLIRALKGADFWPRGTNGELRITALNDTSFLRD